MSTWDTDQLDRLGDAEEVDVSSYRPDGSLRPFTTIWCARVGDDLYVRSAYGPENGWFRRARAAGHGRIRAGDDDVEVRYEPAPHDVHDALDAVYHAKYDSHGPQVVGPVVGPQVVDVTLRLVRTGGDDPHG